MWRWVKSGVYSCKRLELWAKPPPIKLLCTYLMENLGGVGCVLPPYVFFDRLRKKRYYLRHTDIDLLQKLNFWYNGLIVIPRDQETTLQCLQSERKAKNSENFPCVMINLFFAVFQSPIQAFNGFCLQPASSNCDPADNTRLVYHKVARCKNNYMFFTYKNEVLIHTCSGKRVCPQGKYCEQSWKFGMRYGRMRARAAGKRRSREKQGLSPSEENLSSFLLPRERAWSEQARQQT